MIDARKLNFLIAVGGVFGSLYFSEVLGYPPCALCWIQRVFLYPLAILYGVALLSDDKAHRKYVLPFVILGAGIALYHNLLYFDVIPEAITPCTQGVSCKSRQLELFGFITIPLLSLGAFVGMAALEVLTLNRKQRGESEK